MKQHFIVDINGKTFQVPLLNGVGEANISLRENWFTHLARRFKLTPGTHFLDIGANVGQTLLSFRSEYDNPYWGFEPNPICNYYLEELIKLNGFKEARILPIGLAAEDSLVKFYSKSGIDTGATIISDFRHGYYVADEVKYVPVFSLDHLALDFGTISLIKIDVEGAELGVVRGMINLIKQHQPVIICEVLDYHSEDSQALAQGNANSLVELIKQMEYSIHRIDHATDKLEFQEVQEIKLKRFDDSSYDQNDYVFLPKSFTRFPHLN